jgi:mRNA-degrading endonuclease RelE of RelBE toxin-antitoxin system
VGIAFGATRQFEKDLKRLSKRYKLLFDDIEPVVHSIKTGECVGTLLTQVGCFEAFKVRIANTSISKGKSGGFRLIYAYFDGKKRDAVIALALYCKQDVATIRDKVLIRLIGEAQDVLASIDPSVFEGEEFHQRP